MNARRLRVSLRWILCAGAALVLVSAIGCGSSKRAMNPTTVRSGGLQDADYPANEPASQSLDSALAELDAYPCPEGVDAALFEELKDALAEALETKLTESRPGSPARLLASPEEQDGHSMLCPYKSVATPPTGDANRVNDLQITDDGDGTFTLSWHYRNLGDYDQNGVVGIEDITPLAQHFGEDTAPENEWIDGDSDGRVHISDITPIAIYFGVEVAEYEIEGAASVEGEFAEIGAVVMDDATGKDTGRAVLEYALTPGENGYFRVVPRDGEGTPGEASNIVGLALEVLSVSPLEVKEGTVVTFTAEVTGAGPIAYEWDFGGQAVPATSTEAEPEVVLTRDVGEFSASLTVTNPQGDVIFPFTLIKLAREWKFETILSNPEGDPGGFYLQEYGGKLWFYAHDGGSPAQKYLVSGLPANWNFEEITASGYFELDSQGRPGLVNVIGPFLDKTLTLWEKRGGEWETAELLNYRTLGRISFVYAAGDEPFITFSLPDAPNSSWIEYFWRKDGEWERGIVDEPGRPDRLAYCMTTDPEDNPVLCYMTDAEGVFEELTVAWWQPETEEWLIILVDVDWSGDTWKTGYYPDLDFRNDGKLAVTYSSISQEIEPDIRYDRLIYAVYDGETWDKELVDERLSYGSQSYYPKSLDHNALDNAAIAYSHRKRDDSYDIDTVVEWFDGSEWRTCVLDEGAGSNYKKPYVVCARDGTTYVLFSNDVRKEVVLARYE